jgi:hypothetical protein
VFEIFSIKKFFQKSFSCEKFLVFVLEIFVIKKRFSRLKNNNLIIIRVLNVKIKTQKSTLAKKRLHHKRTFDRKHNNGCLRGCPGQIKNFPVHLNVLLV